MSRQSDSIGDVVQRNLASGALVGAGAYVVGYLVTFLLTAIDGVESDPIESWKFVGWVFYGGHNVEISGTASAGDASLSRTVGVFEQGVFEVGNAVPQVVYFLVPVVVLFGAGYAASQRADTHRFDTAKVAAVGSTITVGYLGLAVVGVFLFQVSGFDGGLTVAPELGTAVVIAGIVYPLVLGAVGAVAANSRESGRSGGRLR